MRRLSFLIIATFISVCGFPQKSPHGDAFTVNCSDCHTTESWKVDFRMITFDHGNTKFPLTGQHQAVNCRLCHQSLEFTKAGKECVSCHTDLHNQTVGTDCSRCHTTNSWIVNNITELHQKSRFPLVGPHITADCYDCHINASPSLLNFGPLGVECIDCHQDDYNATTNPDHETGGFSTNCTDCHSMTSFSWAGAGINHSFFPLTLGHDILDCNRCHPGGNFTGTSPVCFSCHESDYNSSSSPGHVSLNFSTNCTDCHTTNPGWTPAEFRDHDTRFFPIYSGEHNGTWSICSECHTNPANYVQFTCIDCHEHNQADMNEEHGEVSGYEYNSIACYGCHPTGSAEGAFNHSTSGFPLTGAHTSVECSQCHISGYAGTTTICYDCHTTDFNLSKNPNHVEINIPTDCGTCHTTNPGWAPATFPIHNNYYVLAGAHVAIANDCAVCHNGNYNSTPNTCFGCHQNDYNQTTNPNHAAAQFPTTCADCHSQNAWIPANWDHDGQYFPIYSGKHQGEWNSCSDCHKNPSNYSEFTCTTSCHPQSEMDDEHSGVTGYSYNSNACYNCHPNGTAPKMMERNIHKNH